MHACMEVCVYVCIYACMYLENDITISKNDSVLIIQSGFLADQSRM